MKKLDNKSLKKVSGGAKKTTPKAGARKTAKPVVGKDVGAKSMPMKMNFNSYMTASVPACGPKKLPNETQIKTKKKKK